MKKLLLMDYLRRWKWFLLTLGVFEIAVSGFMPFDRLSGALTVVSYCGPMLLSFDLASGAARVCQSLPISRRDLAVFWRSVALGLPLVLFAFAVVLRSLLKGAFGLGGSPSISQVSFCFLYAFLCSGATFYLLTHLPRSVPHGVREQAKTGFVGLLWGLAVGAGGLLPLTLPEVWQGVPQWLWGIMAVAMVLTILGWFRAEILVLSRVAPLQDHESRAAPARVTTALASGRFSGLNLLFGTIFLSNLGIIVAFVGVFLSVQVLLRQGWHESLPLLVNQTIQEPTTFFVLAPIVMITGFRWLINLRHFRALPISGLMATLVVGSAFVIPAALMIAVIGVLQAFCGQQPLTIEWLSRAILITVPVLLAPAILLHVGLGTRAFMIVLMLGTASAPAFVLVTSQIPISVRVLIWMGAWVFGAWLLHRVICKGSNPYRQPMYWPMGAPR